MPSCCIYEVLDGILFLNRIYANVNEFHISETFLKCSEYVTIGAKLCVFHVLLCAITICLKNNQSIEVLTGVDLIDYHLFKMNDM